MRNLVIVGCVVSALAFSHSALASRDLYQEMSEYLLDNLRDEAFLPTPYGADSRFKPKTIWAYVDSAQQKGKFQFVRRQKAWMVASSGLAIYPDELVPLNYAPISLPTRDQDVGRMMALTAALGAKLLPKDVEAELSVARSKNLKFEITLPEAEIEYCYLEDLRAAEGFRAGALEGLRNRLKKNDVDPPRRTITAAIRVKGARIAVNSDRSFDFSANAGVQALLSTLGFSWNSTTKNFDALDISGWRYIAYQALLADGDGRISTAVQAGVDTSREANSLPIETR